MKATKTEEKGTQDSLEALRIALDSVVEEANRRAEERLEQRAREIADEEIAKLGMMMRDDGSIVPQDYAHQEGGVFELPKGPKSIGLLANFLLTESWKPIVVKTDKEGKFDEKAVREATTNFLLGNPITAAAFTDADELILQAMEASMQKWHLDPHAQSLARTVKTYVAGSGIEISCPVQKIQQELDRFWKDNRMPQRIKRAVPRRWITGEHYFRYFIGSDGRIRIHDRTIPTEIAKIETHPEDVEMRLAIGRRKPDGDGNVRMTSADPNEVENLEWFADINYWEQYDDPMFRETSRVHGDLSRNDLMQMVKFDDSSSIRGYPSMYSVLRYLTYYEHFVVDRIILNHERSKVVWVRKITGNRGIEGGRAQSVPRSGQTLTETDRIEWRAVNAQINADDVKEDARLIRLAISAGTGFPEHVIFQDASNEVYASIRKQDTPFSQAIQSEQQDWGETIKEMIRVVLREKLKRNALSKTYRLPTFTLESYESMMERLVSMIEDGADSVSLVEEVTGMSRDAKTKVERIDTLELPIDVKFPAVVQEDPLAMAQESEILSRTNIASLHDLAAKHGLRWDQQFPRIKAEKKLLSELVVAPDQPNGPQPGKPKSNTDSKPASNRNDKPEEK